MKSRFVVWVHSLVPWLLTVSLIIGSVALLLSPDWKIKTIECREKTQAPCVPEITSWLISYYGKPVLLLNTRSLTHALIERFPYLENVELKVALPHTLEVTLIGSPPFAKLNWTSQTVVVTQSGYKTSFAPPPGSLPEIFIAYDVPWMHDVEATKAPAEILNGIKLVNLLQKSGVTYAKVELSDTDTITISLDTGVKVLFSPLGEPQHELATLQAILSASTINPEVKVIDVRFNKPVLKSTENTTMPISSGSGDLKE